MSKNIYHEINLKINLFNELNILQIRRFPLKLNKKIYLIIYAKIYVFYYSDKNKFPKDSNTNAYNA